MKMVKTMGALAVVAGLLFSSCTGAAPRGTEHSVGKSTDITYFKASGKMTVDSVTLDFWPENGKVLSDPQEDGNQFVRVALSFENTGEENWKMNYTNVTVDTASEEGVSLTSLINKSNSSDRLESKELAAGEKTSGALYFEVPASEDLSSLKVSYKGYENSESTEYKVELQ